MLYVSGATLPSIIDCSFSRGEGKVTGKKKERNLFFFLHAFFFIEVSPSPIQVASLRFILFKRFLLLYMPMKCSLGFDNPWRSSAYVRRL